MEPWVANSIALFLLTAVVGVFGIALLWRIGSWYVSPAAALTHDEGRPLNSVAPQLATHRDGDEYHLTFEGDYTFLVFGNEGCAPCKELVRVAATHPATVRMRLVYVSDTDSPDLDPDTETRWETYRYDDEDSQRRAWQAPVSPYFHVIDAGGRIAAKGVANKPDHLDRLFSLSPRGLIAYGMVGVPSEESMN
jgi:hypothetical protein